MCVCVCVCVCVWSKFQWGVCLSLYTIFRMVCPLLTTVLFVGVFKFQFTQLSPFAYPHVTVTRFSRGAGCSSVDSVPAFEAVGRRIDPSQWTQLQFGLFSVPTSGPQLVYQRPWYVLFCLWKSAYKRSLAAYRKE